MRSLYEQCSEAEVQGGGTKITEPTVDGATQDFRVRLEDIILTDSKRGHGLLYIVEFTVLEGTERNPPGSRRSWVEKPERRPKTGPGAIKAFAAAVAGITGSDPVVPPSVFEAIESGKYRGVELNLTVEKIKTQAGFDFWKHTWRKPSGEKLVAPPIPSLTKEAWLAGDGGGTEHPQDPTYEYHPDHPDWGVRKVSER